MRMPAALWIRQRPAFQALKDAGEHGVGIKKRTAERKIPYVSSGSLAVKKQCSKEWSKEKESASTQKSKKHAEKKVWSVTWRICF